MAKKETLIKTEKKEVVPVNKADDLVLLREIALVVGGKNAGEAVDLLISNKHVNEFIIAKKLDLTINQTRNVLYKLADEGLVSSIRKKDKKKGWYTYFWRFNVEKALLLLKKNLIKDLGNLENQLNSREVKQFYICAICHAEVTEETALLHDFTCPECGEIYVLKDSSANISEIKSAISKINNKVKEVDVQLVIIEAKKVKRMERERKKLEKEKAEKRKKAAEARRKTAALKRKTAKKEVKKEVKKVVKKKSSKKKKVAKKKVKKATKKKPAKKKKVVKKKAKKKK